MQGTFGFIPVEFWSELNFDKLIVIGTYMLCNTANDIQLDMQLYGILKPIDFKICDFLYKTYKIFFINATQQSLQLQLGVQTDRMRIG